MRWRHRLRRRWRRRRGRRFIADGGLKVREIARELANRLDRDCLGRVGGDRFHRVEAHLVSHAPRKHDDTACLDKVGRVNCPLLSPVLSILLAVREEQQDLSRPRAASGEELPCRFEAGGDRGLAVRLHLVDCRVDIDLVGRPSDARRRNRLKGHHREARRVWAEGVVVHQKCGEGLQPVGPLHRADGLGLFHRAALVEHQNEVNRRRAGRLGRRGRRRGRWRRRRRRRRRWRRRWRRRRWRRRRWRWRRW